jgi:hypothetical protein
VVWACGAVFLVRDLMQRKQPASYVVGLHMIQLQPACMHRHPRTASGKGIHSATALLCCPW